MGLIAMWHARCCLSGSGIPGFQLHRIVADSCGQGHWTWYGCHLCVTERDHTVDVQHSPEYKWRSCSEGVKYCLDESWDLMRLMQGGANGGDCSHTQTCIQWLAYSRYHVMHIHKHSCKCAAVTAGYCSGVGWGRVSDIIVLCENGGHEQKLVSALLIHLHTHAHMHIPSSTETLWYWARQSITETG